MTSRLCQELDLSAAAGTPEKTKVGVNGSDVYTEEGLGNLLLAFYTSLNRGMDASSIREFIDKILKNKTDKVEQDLFTLVWQTRNIRGGKGERKIFYEMLNALCEKYTGLDKYLFKLMGEFGYYKDAFRVSDAVFEGLLDSLIEKIKEDVEATRPSLLAKWLPRETSKNATEKARKIAGRMYAGRNIRKSLKEYRKTIAAINKKLKTTEINMCGREWRTIEPSHVPARCFTKNRMAFFNKKKEKVRYREHEVDRYPDNEDRVECAIYFREFIDKVKSGEKKMKGADTLYPHEIVSNYWSSYDYKNVEDEANEVYQAQWNAIRDKTGADSKLRKTIPMCDFSGSMNGTPLLVSLALGLLISEINDEAFRNRILTFDSTPSWVSFEGKNTLKEKIGYLQEKNVGQGLSTNFEAACRMILDKMMEAKISPGEEPEDLLVLTDMGWNQASTNDPYGQPKKNSPQWATHVTLLKEAFRTEGEKLWGEGKGWKMPRIVIWNLRAEFKEYHTKAEEEGVVLLSGWSPSVLKSLQNNMTPLDCFYEILNDSKYDIVRQTWNEYKASKQTN